MSNIAKGTRPVKTDYNSLATAERFLGWFPEAHLFPAGNGTKKPLLKTPKDDRTAHFLNVASNSPPQIKRWSLEFSNCWWGCASKKSALIPFDVDGPPNPGPKDKQGWVSLRKLEAAGFTLPRTYKQRSPSGGMHVIMRGPHRFTASKIAPDIDTPVHFIIAGCGDYHPNAGTVMTIADAPQWLLDKIAPTRTEPRAPAVDPISLDLFQRMLAVTPYEGRHDYADWLNFLFACHEAAGGDPAEFLQAFQDWSLKDPDQNWTHPTSDEVIAAKWFSAADDRSDAVTRGSWFKVLKELGHGDLVSEAMGDAQQAEDFAAFQADPVDEIIATALLPKKTDDDLIRDILGDDEENLGEPLSNAEMRSSKFERQKYAVAGLVMQGIPNCLYGDGGIGKTTVGQEIGNAVAAGKPIFGRGTIQAPVLMVLSEDDYGEAWPRNEATCSKLLKLTDAESDALQVKTWCVPGHDISIARIGEDGKLELLPFYHRLRRRLKAQPGTFVVLDSLVDIAQMGEAHRLPVNIFFKRVMMSLCKETGATILVLAHPSKAAMKDGTYYSGSTAYRNAVRCMMVMKAADKVNRTLGLNKNQYGPGDVVIRLKWEGGIFINSTGDTDTERVKYGLVLSMIRDLTAKGRSVAMNTRGGEETPATIMRRLNGTPGMNFEMTVDEVTEYMRKIDDCGDLHYVKAKGKTPAHFEVAQPPTDFTDDGVEDEFTPLRQ